MITHFAHVKITLEAGGKSSTIEMTDCSMQTDPLCTTVWKYENGKLLERSFLTRCMVAIETELTAQSQAEILRSYVQPGLLADEAGGALFSTKEGN